jgi:hypothetical protein
LILFVIVLNMALLSLPADSAGTVERRFSELPPLGAAELQVNASYPVVDTGQALCYDDSGAEIACPAEGAAFYGQDAQYDGSQPSFTDNGDGAITDNVTGVMWQQSADTDGDGDIDAADKLTYNGAGNYCANLTRAGHTDWRLPDIKTLYSLIDFGGLDPSGYSGSDTSGLIPFIDADYFDFAYGDTAAGERIIDAQYASSSLYVSTTLEQMLFGVNFADGRIKGYGLTMPGPGNVEKTFYVICARGNTAYGQNDLVDNGDGTLTDSASGLMWAQDDSGAGLNWEEALAWVEAQNAANYLGYSDWRLPNAKELQSIVDYSRSPDTTNSAAIDPLFNATAITNEAGQTDYPFYWSSTTHANWTATPGMWGVYVAFGRALGYMNGTWIDVHGAGAQRSDPKSGDPVDWPIGNGPQGDAVRIYNYVRLVRDTGGDEPNTPPIAEAGGPYSGEQGSLITLDGSTSSDPDGTVVRHDWDLDNDGQYDDGHGPTATFTATQIGTFTIGLVVYDDDGAQDTDMATVTVAGGPAYIAYLPFVAKDDSDQPPYTLEQTLSDQAQGMTIAFDGLAFLTGNLGADSFFPPGKVADFWGFQYLRDNDPTEMGHNTDFLTRASLNMLHVLTHAQRLELIALAEDQVDDINRYAYDRFVLMDAFRRLLEGDLPAGATGLDQAAVQAYSADLYHLDGEISYERAQVMGAQIAAFTTEQRAYLDAMVGQGMLDWPVVDEPPELQGLDHDVKVAVMTYAGDMFSWYAGSVEADVYFCPERQGTYFGSFYMKDAPAVGNPGYSIPVTLTAEMGDEFLQVLMPEQSSTITALVEAQKPALYEIVDRREDVAILLRQFMTGGAPNQDTVLDLMARYGELDGEIVYRYATVFAQVGQSLTAEQQAELDALRLQILGPDFLFPTGAYLYAEPISMPEIPSTDFLFE